jgi:signal transduction histidine kinase
VTPFRNVRRDGPLWAAARVAAVATAIAAVLYAAASVGMIALAVNRVSQQLDAELQARLLFLQHRPNLLLVQGQPHHETDQEGMVTTMYWLVNPDGTEIVSPASGPALPASLQGVVGPTTATIDGREYRLVGGPVIAGPGRIGIPGFGGPELRSPSVGDWLVVGEQTGLIDYTVRALVGASILLGIPILALTFLAALAIGRWSAAPIERGRRRVLEFTADASHELRTPLQVIEAEVSLALMHERDAASYRSTIENVGRESERLRHMVDDLLWLARFDSRPGSPKPAAVDLRELAADAVERFHALAQRKRQTLRQTGDGPGPALVLGPRDWLDRLLGVLIDNACRYTPEGGIIDVSVGVREGQVELRVEDSGPGIPVAERGRIFDRFRRASDQGGGAGLGLAIGNAVVTATQGRWRIGDSPLGGASISVSWPAARGGGRQRGGDPARRAAPEAAAPPTRHPA